MLENQLDPARSEVSVNIPPAVNHCCGFGAGERQGFTGHQLGSVSAVCPSYRALVQGAVAAPGGPGSTAGPSPWAVLPVQSTL